jgi:hypothetical protein
MSTCVHTPPPPPVCVALIFSFLCCDVFCVMRCVLCAHRYHCSFLNVSSVFSWMSLRFSLTFIASSFLWCVFCYVLCLMCPLLPLFILECLFGLLLPIFLEVMACLVVYQIIIYKRRTSYLYCMYIDLLNIEQHW